MVFMFSKVLFLVSLFCVHQSYHHFFHRSPIFLNHFSLVKQSYQNNIHQSSQGEDFSFISNDWFAFGGCQVLLPDNRVPKSIIHFIGGFLVGTSPSVTYSELLKVLASQGHLIVATTIPSFNPNHNKTSIEVTKQFVDCYKTTLTSLIGPEIKNVPIIGLSHSLGGKLMSLSNSNKKLRKAIPKKAGNIFLAFNNYDMMQSVEFSTNKATEKIYEQIPNIEKVINTVVNAVPTEFQDILSSAFLGAGESSSSSNKVSDNNDGFSNSDKAIGNEIIKRNNQYNNNNDNGISSSVASGLQNLFSQGSKFLDSIDKLNVTSLTSTLSSTLDTLSDSLDNADTSSFLNEFDKLMDEFGGSGMKQSKDVNGDTNDRNKDGRNDNNSGNKIIRNQDDLKSTINTAKTTITDNIKSLHDTLYTTARVIQDESNGSGSFSSGSNSKTTTSSSSSSSFPFNSSNFDTLKSQFEFVPTPQETWEIISQGYNIQKNILFQFSADEIDQSVELENILRKRGCDVVLFKVPGNHLTPNSITLSASYNTPSNNDDEKDVDTNKRKEQNNIYNGDDVDNTNSKTSPQDTKASNSNNSESMFIRYLCMTINRLVMEHSMDLLDSTTVEDGNLILPSS